MKKIKSSFSRWLNWSDRKNSIDCEFQVTEGLPLPVPNVNYDEQLRITKILKTLPVGGSFPVRSKLSNSVRKVAKVLFPEYKIVVKNFGSSHRVFRIA